MRHLSFFTTLLKLLVMQYLEDILTHKQYLIDQIEEVKGDIEDCEVFLFSAYDNEEDIQDIQDAEIELKDHKAELIALQDELNNL